METQIDALDSLTGWSITGGAVVGLYETFEPGPRENRIAGGLAASIYVDFTAAGVATKTVVNALTGMSALRFWIHSDRGQGVNGPYHLSVDFGFGKYWVPCPRDWQPVTIWLPSGAAVSKIEFESSEVDFIQVSNVIAFREQLPLDILNTVIAGITAKLPAPIPVGTITGSAGARTATIAKSAAQRRIEPYNQIVFGGERHIVTKGTDSSVEFAADLDGAVLLSAQAAAPISLEYAVRLGSEDMIFREPAVIVWGLSNEKVPVDHHEGSTVSSLRVATVSPVFDGESTVQRTGPMRRLVFQVDCVATKEGDLAALQNSVQTFLDRQECYVHNINLILNQDGPSARGDSTRMGQIPKVSFTISVEYEDESTWPKLTRPLPRAMATTVSLTPR